MDCTSLRLRSRWWFGLLAATALGSASCAVVTACDTPVYRYAMYRWEPAPYELYCFHRQQLDETGVAIRDVVDRLGGSQPPAANLMFVAVDVEQDKELKGVPPDVKDAWLKSPQQTPWYLVASPVGRHVHAGSLTVDQVVALTDSPRRTAIGELLAAGRAGVYVLLTGDDPGANQQAEAEIRQVLDDLAAGRLALYAPPTDSSAAPSNPTLPEFGLITFPRTELSEKWLVDCLLGLEPDLQTSSEPMAFLVYGRGRAIFSCLGKGICRDNLEQDITFITGACSCTVKEQNPGVDLLMRYDWNRVATELSQRFGTEEGSLYRFGGDMLFPELMLPADDLPAATASDATSAAPGGVEQVAAAELVPPLADSIDATPSAAERAATTGEPPLAVPPKSTPSAGTAGAPPTTDGAVVDLTHTDPVARTWHTTLWVGGGLAGALVVLLAATWLVLRPR